MILGIGLWTFLRALFTGAPAAALENLALRHQVLVLRRSVPRPRLARWDRVPLGLDVSGLGGLAIQSRHRAVCDGSGVAPPRLPPLLAVEDQAEPDRPPEARRRGFAT